MPPAVFANRKGDILSRVDRFLNAVKRSDLKKIGAFLRTLPRESPGFGQVLRGFDKSPLRGSALKHVEQHFFGAEGKAYFDDDFEAIFVQGLITAIDAMLEGKPSGKPLPIDSYWLVAGTDCQVVVTQSKQQVTLLLVTPPPSTRQRPVALEDEAVWTIRQGVTVQRTGHRRAASAGKRTAKKATKKKSAKTKKAAK